MSFANEILDAIEIMVKQVVEDNTTKIYKGVCKSITTTTCTLTINGKDNTVKYYGGTPTVGTVYQVFIPFGNMSAAFIIVPGTTGGSGTTGVSSVNGKTGDVVLNANDVGALPSSTTIPTKTSQLDNDSGFIDDSALSGYAKTSDIPTQTSQLTNNSGFITASDVPVQSVDGATGAVVTNAVKTTVQSLSDAQKSQARVNIGAGTSSFDGDYNSLDNKPTIPTQTSQLENNSGFITDADVPTKVSQLENDSGYITDAALDGYAKTTDIPTKVSQLDNDSGFVDATGAKDAAPVQSVDGETGDVVTNAVKTTAQTLTVAQQKRARVNIGAGTSSFSGSYNDLTDKPTIPTKTSDITNDSGYITSDDVPVKSVNGKTGVVSLGASDVGAVATSDITQTLGTSTTKVPSEKAVSDALSGAGAGDMLKSVYDPDSSVETAGGIPAYVEANGGKIDTIKVNGTAQDIVDKAVDITVPTNNNQLTNGAGYITADEAPVKSVNGQTGDVIVEADIPDNLVKYTALSDVQSVDSLNADTLEGHDAAYFATATALSSINTQVAANTNNITTLSTGLSTANTNITTLQNDKVNKAGDTMTGVLVAQANTNYTTAQVRNIIISTADPSGGSNGMIWIKYAE